MAEPESDEAPRADRRPGAVPEPPPPGDPRRGPDAAGQPEPADSRREAPGAVVIRRPGPRIVGDPGPAPLGHHPPSVHVGPPARSHGGYPDPAVVRHPFPVPVRREPLVEDLLVGDVLTGRRDVGVGLGGRRWRAAGVVVGWRRWPIRRRRRGGLRDRGRLAHYFALVEATAARDGSRERADREELSWGHHGDALHSASWTPGSL